MTTGTALITQAMKKIGVVTKSETLDADESADGLVALNNMLSSWSNDSLLTYVRVRESFTLTPGTAAYSIGAGQTFNTAKPVAIIEAHVREGITDYPVIIISDEEYEALPDKSSQESTPDFLNYSNGHPYGTIRLYYTPSSSNALHLLSEKPLAALTLAGTVDLPAGWEHAIVYNLAVLLAPEYGVEPSPIVMEEARNSKAMIKTAIAKNRDLSFVSESVGFNDIMIGTF